MPQRRRRPPCSAWASDPVSAWVPSSGASLPGPSSARSAPTKAAGAPAVCCRRSRLPLGRRLRPHLPLLPCRLSPATPTQPKQSSTTTMSGQQGEPPAEAAAGQRRLPTAATGGRRRAALLFGRREVPGGRAPSAPLLPLVSLTLLLPHACPWLPCPLQRSTRAAPRCPAAAWPR